MRLKAEWAIDSEAMRVRGIIYYYLVKSNQLVKNIENKKLYLVKSRFYSFFCRQKARAFRYWWAITYSLVVAKPIRM